MQKVISVNLNGNAYQFDEDAYGLLSAYLVRAQTQLEHNPDRAEIMADLEQAIAEKCGRFLAPHKSVVAAAEVQKVIDEMGPVDSGAADADSAAGAQTGKEKDKSEAAAPGTPKRLYLIREGAMCFGVCNGLAAYFNVDVTIMRLAFVALAILTSGAWILVYLIMMFVVPRADTPEQRAAAYGVTFNAQQLINQAKQKYADLKSSRQSNRYWKMQRRQWKQWRRTMREQSRWAATAWRGSGGYAAGPATVVLAPLFGIFELGLIVLLVYAIYSLIKWHAIFGWRPPEQIPLWAGILILLALYSVVVSPFVAARHTLHFRSGGLVYRHSTALDEVVPLVVLGVLVWLGYLYVPAVHHFIQNILIALHLRGYQ